MHWYVYRQLLICFTHRGCCFPLEPGIEYTQPSGQHQITIALSKAQTDSAMLSMRVKQSLKRKREREIENDIQDPIVRYGYRLAADFKTLTENADEKTVIVMIVALRDGTLTDRQITELMYRVASNENKVPITFVSQPVSRNGEAIGKETQVKWLDANQMTFQEIADLLNDYGLTRRGVVW
jgi:hypothetical protein